MTRTAWSMALIVGAISVTGPAAQAQSVESRVNAVQNGTVLMTFATRPGVCGDGHGSTWTHRSGSTYSRSMNGWVCIAGPMTAAIGRAGGAVVSIRTWIGGPKRTVAPETSIGDVPPAEAAHYLLSLARAGSGTSADEAIAAAALADGVNLAPDLTALARDENASIESRKQALFWLGQSEDESSKDLAALYDTMKPFALREHFVFVLSQRQDDASLDKLMDVAQHDPDREVRKRSMFWLGQSKEPRAVKFLRDILTR